MILARTGSIASSYLPQDTTAGFYRSLTLDQPASDLSDFPVLFSGTYSYLATVANGGKVNNANGYDITFYSDAALTTLLKFERVYWDATTGTCEFWVKVPTVASASATVIYLAYGNQSISTDQQDAVNVWTNGFVLVWHLPDGSTLSANDSTSNAFNGTLVNTPTAATGKIDGGANLVRTSNQAITKSDNASLDFGTANFTVSAWIKKASNGIYGGIASKNAASDNGWTIGVNNSDVMEFYCVESGGYDSAPTTGTYTSTAAFYYVVGVRDSSFVRIYVDGSQAGTPGTNNSRNVDNAEAFASGAYRSGDLTSNMFNGIVDEVRVINTDRNADWIAAEYSNQNDPANFYVVGSETPA